LRPYQDPQNFSARIALHAKYTRALVPRYAWLVRRVEWPWDGRILESAAARRCTPSLIHDGPPWRFACMLRPGAASWRRRTGVTPSDTRRQKRRRAGRHQEPDLDRLVVLLHARLSVGLFGQQARWRRSRSMVNNCFQ
jgi:AraC-like DNA-binding protein